AVVICQVDDGGVPTACVDLVASTPDLKGLTCVGAKAASATARGRIDGAAADAAVDLVAICSYGAATNLYRVHAGAPGTYTAKALFPDGITPSLFELQIGDINGDTVDDVLAR